MSNETGGRSLAEPRNTAGADHSQAVPFVPKSMIQNVEAFHHRSGGTADPRTAGHDDRWLLKSRS